MPERASDTKYIHAYRVPQCLSSRPTWDLLAPLPQASVSPPEPKGEATHSPAGKRGWGSPNSDDWRKILALCVLCGVRLSLRVATRCKKDHLVLLFFKIAVFRRKITFKTVTCWTRSSSHAAQVTSLPILKNAMHISQINGSQTNVLHRACYTSNKLF
jgi:hypothetical protein